MMSVGERVIADLRQAVFAHVVGLPPAFYDASRTGELASRLTNDTEQIRQVIGFGVSMFLRNGLMMVGALVLLFPVVYLIYFAQQATMVVRNYLVAVPFLVFCAARGFGWLHRLLPSARAQTVGLALALVALGISFADQIQAVNQALGKAVSRGIIKKNTASRWLSRLSRSASRISAPD